jgi:hypothetical protein
MRRGKAGPVNKKDGRARGRGKREIYFAGLYLIFPGFSRGSLGLFYAHNLPGFRP